MRYRNNDGLNYIKQYPELKKWINTCICCGSIGYNPNLPEVLTTNWGQGECITFKAQYIRKYFNPLKVNEFGMCKTCQKLNHIL